jgi:hypothetical protein
LLTIQAQIWAEMKQTLSVLLKHILFALPLLLNYHHHFFISLPCCFSNTKFDTITITTTLFPLFLFSFQVLQVCETLAIR